jgi:hypothetical protein
MAALSKHGTPPMRNEQVDEEVRILGAASLLTHGTGGPVSELLNGAPLEFGEVNAFRNGQEAASSADRA